MAAVLGAGEMERKVPLLINGEPNPELRLEGHPSPPNISFYHPHPASVPPAGAS